MHSDSNVLQHFFLRHLQQIHAIPKARWGECAGKLALPFALTGAFWSPVSSEGPAGVHPEAVSGSFLGVFVCWRAWREISPATGPDFWEATAEIGVQKVWHTANDCWRSRRANGGFRCGSRIRMESSRKPVDAVCAASTCRKQKRIPCGVRMRYGRTEETCTRWRADRNTGTTSTARGRKTN